MTPSALRAPFRRLLPALALAAAATAAPAADLSLDPEDRALLRAEVRNYLLEHPEVIMEAVKALEDRRLAAEAAAADTLVSDNADAIFNDGYSHVAGNPDGDVTVVEFTDYNCGYCKKAHEEVRQLISSDPGIRYVIKEFPILGPSSVTAARAALAALAQDDGAHYMAFNDALMSHRGGLSDAQVWLLAEDAGLDADRLKRDAASPEIAARIEKTYDLARTLQINGTPTFVMGDRLLRGYVPLDALEDAVAEIRERRG